MTKKEPGTLRDNLSMMLRTVKDHWCYRVDMVGPELSHESGVKRDLYTLIKLGLVERRSPTIKRDPAVLKRKRGSSTLHEQLQYRLSEAGKLWIKNNPL